MAGSSQPSWQSCWQHWPAHPVCWPTCPAWPPPPSATSCPAPSPPRARSRWSWIRIWKLNSNWRLKLSSFPWTRPPPQREPPWWRHGRSARRSTGRCQNPLGWQLPGRPCSSFTRWRLESFIPVPEQKKHIGSFPIWSQMLQQIVLHYGLVSHLQKLSMHLTDCLSTPQLLEWCWEAPWTCRLVGSPSRTSPTAGTPFSCGSPHCSGRRVCWTPQSCSHQMQRSREQSRAHPHWLPEGRVCGWNRRWTWRCFRLTHAQGAVQAIPHIFPKFWFWHWLLETAKVLLPSTVAASELKPSPPRAEKWKSISQLSKPPTSVTDSEESCFLNSSRQIVSSSPLFKSSKTLLTYSNFSALKAISVQNSNSCFLALVWWRWKGVELYYPKVLWSPFHGTLKISNTIMIFKPHISRIKPVLIHIITMFPCDTVIANISVTDDHVHNICMKLLDLQTGLAGGICKNPAERVWKIHLWTHFFYWEETSNYNVFMNFAQLEIAWFAGLSAKTAADLVWQISHDWK